MATLVTGGAMRTRVDRSGRKGWFGASALFLSAALCAALAVPPVEAATPPPLEQLEAAPATRAGGDMWLPSLFARYRVADGWRAQARPTAVDPPWSQWPNAEGDAGAAAPDGAGDRVDAVAEAAPAVAIASHGDIPEVAFAAYQYAAARSGEVAPGCDVRWTILAGIGRIESNHGRTWGTATTIAATGEVTPRILGPRLDGTNSTAAIRDTDGGVWDGDTVWDRAVGPMQFIPSSWALFGRDGSGNGGADPNNYFDAALSAVAHLCLATPGDYRDRGDLVRALLGYNRSGPYAAAVLAWIDAYDSTGDLPDVRVAEVDSSGRPGGADGADPVGRSPTDSGGSESGRHVALHHEVTGAPHEQSRAPMSDGEQGQGPDDQRGTVSPQRVDRATDPGHSRKGGPGDAVAPEEPGGSGDAVAPEEPGGSGDAGSGETVAPEEPGGSGDSVGPEPGPSTASDGADGPRSSGGDEETGEPHQPGPPDHTEPHGGEPGDRQFPEAEPADGEPSDGQSAEGQPGEGESSEGQPGEEESSEGQPGDGGSSEGQPGDGESSEGQPGDGESSEGQPGDGQFSEGQPGDGEPGEGESAEGPGDGESSEGQPGDGEPADGDEDGGMPSPCEADRWEEWIEEFLDLVDRGERDEFLDWLDPELLWRDSDPAGEGAGQDSVGDGEDSRDLEALLEEFERRRGAGQRFGAPGREEDEHADGRMVVELLVGAENQRDGADLPHATLVIDCEGERIAEWRMDALVDE